jgi:hypothetical protein
MKYKEIQFFTICTVISLYLQKMNTKITDMCTTAKNTTEEYMYSKLDRIFSQLFKRFHINHFNNMSSFDFCYMSY